MKRIETFLALALAGVLGAACGGAAGAGGAATPGPKAPTKPGVVGQGGAAVSSAAAATFDKALDEFMKRDRAGDWAAATCTALAQAFLEAAKTQQQQTGKPFPEAHYNAGLAYARCDRDAEARAQFEAALKADPNFHRAAGQLALYDYAQKKLDLDGVIARLQEIIVAAKFQNVEALVSLAALQMERGNEQPDKEGRNDFANAQLNLQRALAIDDSYMPAFNQLAIYYLERARGEAEKGSKGKKKRRGGLVVAGVRKKVVNQQQLDLAALVASQAIRKNPNYAPIHNTAGLIQVELRNFNGAVKAFGTARRLDPNFFEAHMNYAAVSLSFRGFEEAEKAYRDALRLRPNEFEAHLGLALALRGQITDSNFDKYVAAAQQAIEAARKLDANRAETYYNEAILTQEYKAKATGGDAKATIPTLRRAAELYRQFVAKAGGDPAFAEAVKRANDRAKDIEDTIKFIEEGEKAREEAERNQPPPDVPTGDEAPPEG